MPNVIFMDGVGITPGDQLCRCDSQCECPCWQMMGITGDDEPYYCGTCGCG